MEDLDNIIRPNPHDLLDEKKRQGAMEVLKHFPMLEIRRVSLETLSRWRSQGTWCSAYSEWEELMKNADDQTIISAMSDQTQYATRLRQSPPYVAFRLLLADRKP